MPVVVFDQGPADAAVLIRLRESRDKGLNGPQRRVAGLINAQVVIGLEAVEGEVVDIRSRGSRHAQEQERGSQQHREEMSHNSRVLVGPEPQTSMMLIGRLIGGASYSRSSPGRSSVSQAS